jgi:hypothetical protein
MNIIQKLCGYGYEYVTECLELKNCDVLKQGGIQHSLNLKIQVFCDVTFCLLEITYQCYKGCLHFQGQ